MATRCVSSQVVLGAVVVLIGVVVLAETAGFYGTSAVWNVVPSLFVLVGVYALIRAFAGERVWPANNGMGDVPG